MSCVFRLVCVLASQLSTAKSSIIKFNDTRTEMMFIVHTALYSYVLCVFYMDGVLNIKARKLLLICMYTHLLPSTCSCTAARLYLLVSLRSSAQVVGFHHLATQKK